MSNVVTSIFAGHGYREAALCSLSRHVIGNGIEIGPGHMPFPVFIDGARVSYVDCWTPEQSRTFFPELQDADFPHPDYVVDLNRERLAIFSDETCDFVIASHIIEHLANPIGIIEDVYRVLRPGGILVLMVPNRHRTFDEFRDPTSLQHVIEDYENGETQVSTEHLREYIANVEKKDIAAMAADELEAHMTLHRLRSIHVHCWNEFEFSEMLSHTILNLGIAWQLVDMLTPDAYPESIEFGYVLRKVGDTIDPESCLKMFVTNRNILMSLQSGIANSVRVPENA